MHTELPLKEVEETTFQVERNLSVQPTWRQQQTNFHKKRIYAEILQSAGITRY